MDIKWRQVTSINNHQRSLLILLNVNFTRFLFLIQPVIRVFVILQRNDCDFFQSAMVRFFFFRNRNVLKESRSMLKRFQFEFLLK